MKVFGLADRRAAALLAGVATIALLNAAPAAAQTAPPADAAPTTTPQTDTGDTQDNSGDKKSDDIVVTGTLLRGVAPVGTNVIGLDQTAITSTGAATSNDVLARIPQVSNGFNRATVTATGNGGATIARPNIRNLGASGANTTLVLIDGHRVVGAGVLQTTPDPDIVPPGILDRVEIVPDGGSSIYGSDAIGGVINFITRKKFNGLEVTGRYGIADKYWQFDTNITAGRDWGSGSLYLSYAFAKHDAIFGRERDYVRSISLSNACAPGTIGITSGGTTTFYGLPNRTIGANTCDTAANAAIYPRERRHSVFAGLSQQLNSAISIDIKAFYTGRVTNPLLDTYRTSNATITSANPFFVPIGVGNTSQTVSYSYGPVAGNSIKGTTQLDEWGVTPTLTANLGGGWQLRLLGNYGRSSTSNIVPILNTTLEAQALAGTTTSTALNPYVLSQTSPSVLAGIFNFEDYSKAKQELYGARAILDGRLFTLPGGDVRLAVGTEYNAESFKLATGQHVRGDFSPTAIPSGFASRNVKAIFGEISIPIFGADNGFTGMRSLRLSASARYDDYSDFGGTFNPKVGLTWKPVESLTFRGNYGTSFNAPSLADTAGAVDTRLQVIPISPYVKPGDETSPGGIPTFFRPTVIIAGGNPNLKPQKAKTYSLGADFKPSFIPGLTISGTYYNVNFTNQISLALPGPLLFTSVYAPYVTINPTIAQINAAAPNYRVTGVPSLASLYATPGFAPYLLYDLRRNNLGIVKQDGIDFNVSYVAKTGFGSVNASVAGTYILNRKVSPVTGAAFQDDLAAGNSRFSLVGSLGASVGGFSGQATVYHSAGYSLGTTTPGQSRIKSFNTVDLFFSYDPKGTGVFRDLSFTLNVNNVLDQDPPFLNSGNGYGNGSTLGRLFQFGVRKKF